MRIYAIGDVHGQLDMLRGVHDLIERDGGAGAQVCLLYTSPSPRD